MKDGKPMLNRKFLQIFCRVEVVTDRDARRSSMWTSEGKDGSFIFLTMLKEPSTKSFTLVNEIP
jgi:hypothetical protein